MWGLPCLPVLIMRSGDAGYRGILSILGHLDRGRRRGFSSGFGCFPRVVFPILLRGASFLPLRSLWGCPFIHILPATCLRDSSSSLCPYADIQARRAARGVSPSGLHSLDLAWAPLVLALALSMKLPVCHLYLPRRWSLLRKSLVSAPPFSVIAMLSGERLGVSSSSRSLFLSLSSSFLRNIRGIFLLSQDLALGSRLVSVSLSPVSGVL